ncbi:bifunctional sugar-1-phosphate nucleotidylyltransferase/acetyltransferase [Halorarum salinum]|uniref:Bifunctional protein GlmU n=1 Tax=Halorarum salinum TaxID=2743089 RepID=A0A7D5LDU0_9EURY|nr:bifunctional sugar-1-phosphate nucleotidylyltransferase/acetyltransferase [Halobaculum salinum]QLG64310.1 NTP transferase domain-containing protein [Halobaculum salinum]
MQAVILAAGMGTRMRPLSTVTPKPMLPVADRPLAAHAADAAVAGGADALVFVVGYKASHVRSFFGDRYGGVPVHYANQPVPEGTADAVDAARPYLDGPFAVLNGDNLYDPRSISTLFDRAPAVAAHRVENPSEYGVLSTEGSLVTGVVEKPDDPPTNLANAGAYVFPAAARDWLDVGESERGEHEITDVLARAVDHVDVSAVETDRWLDVARPADLLRANELALADRRGDVEGELAPDATVSDGSAVAEGAAVGSGATLRGAVLVGAGATVSRDATLRGPVVVGAGATVGSGATLRNAVLLPGATVERDVHLEDAVLAPGCGLAPGTDVSGDRENASWEPASLVAPSPSAGGLPY